MSDSGRVTITLGRSGQVVKRDLSSADVSYASSLSLAGTKRSVRDRIGNNVDGYGHSNNKRHRGDNSIQNGFDDGRIDKDDLRLKLMRKSASKGAESNGDKSQIDLREKLTKAVRSPMTSFNSKQRELEPRETSMIRRIPSARSSDDLMRMESMRSSYSPWTLDHIRRRSPDGFPSSSRRISPQRNVEDLQRRPLNRTYESVTPVPYVTRDVESSRPPGTTPASFAARSTMSTLPPVTAKPVTSHLGQLPPSSSVAQRASYVGDEQQSHQTVDGLLHALGLGKYAILFKAEEVDMTALKQMGEHDLKELGIPMGPRKKILLALLPRAKRQQ